MSRTELRGRFEKFVDEQQIAFGMASVVHEADGSVLTDHHGHQIDPLSLEKAVYDFNLLSGDADVMHVERGIGRIVESMVITPEKFALIGETLGVDMPADVATAWWVGFKVFDHEVWNMVKSGLLPDFSITGEGEESVIDA